MRYEFMIFHAPSSVRSTTLFAEIKRYNNYSVIDGSRKFCYELNGEAVQAISRKIRNMVDNGLITVKPISFADFLGYEFEVYFIDNELSDLSTETLELVNLIAKHGNHFDTLIHKGIDE